MLTLRHILINLSSFLFVKSLLQKTSIEVCTRESFVTKCYNSNTTNLISISFSTIHQQQQKPDLQAIFDDILDDQQVQQQQQHQHDLEFIFDNPQIHHQQQQKLDLQTIFDDILDNQQVQQQQQHQPDLDQILTENIFFC